MKITGARAIIECLTEQGVDTVFGYPGGTILPLYDALSRSSIRHILTVHEQGAAHAADGYARASGRTGVCIATSGPGATNLVTGLAAAFMDSIPLVAITGQVPTGQIGRDAFQEVDITGMTMAITKHNYLVKDIQQLPDILRRAFEIAGSGRPGPVLVDIPRDVQTAELEFVPATPAPAVPRPASERTPRIVAASALISRAQRPVMIVGGGVITAEAHQPVRALAERCKLPVVSTLMGLGAFSGSHPQFLGLTGLHGLRAANNAVHGADLLIAVGSRFSDRVTSDRSSYTEGKDVIHIDIDPAEIDKNVAAHIGLAGDTAGILTELAALAQPGDLTAWWATIQEWRQEFPVDKTAPLPVPWVMEQISQSAARKAVVFTTDVGQHQMWAAQYLQIEQPRSFITSGGLGAMGFGLPAALGAQLAVPDKRVVHLAGDGGFKMTGNELYTIAALKLPVISIIVNNDGLGMIRQLQKVFYQEQYYAADLPPIMDFAAYAGAFGVPATVANTKEEFAQALTRAWNSTGPYLIVVNVSDGQMVNPMLAPGASLNEYAKV
ncbi:MAG TPA: biosynthetic-type acetolactate synthase large subunit [Patescibacteria group bacterium]|nr:biosynthetic-type acetolactate synthase large subunit [Patescibacteria group bacterium]